MRALVTGAAGFIGSHITERLIADGHQVIGVDDLSAGKMNNIPDSIYGFVQADICDIADYGYVLDDVDVVFHNAASKKNICLHDPLRDLKVNGGGTLSLLIECNKKGVRKFVHASTGSVYGEVDGKTTESSPLNPCSYYGVSKLAGERYVQMFHKNYGMDTTILRYFHVWGPRQEYSQETGGVIAIFIDKLSKLEPITIFGDGMQARVFTHVNDVVEANMRAWVNPAATGMVFNCNATEKTTILDAAHLLMRDTGVVVPVHYTNPLEGDIYNFDVDNSLIRDVLEMDFVNFSEYF